MRHTGTFVCPVMLTVVLALPASAAPPTTTPALVTMSAVEVLRYSDEPSQSRLLLKGPFMRMESLDPKFDSVAIQNSGTGQVLGLSTRTRTARTTLFKKPSFPDLAWYKRISELNGEPIGTSRIAGREAVGIHAVTEWPDIGVAWWNRRLELNIWSDPATHLPLRIEFIEVGGEHSLEQIQFNVALDDALFDMKVPENYRLIETRGLKPDQLRPSATPDEAAALVIIPGVGIGGAEFGMSRPQVEAVFGQSESSIEPEPGTWMLHYFSRGLILEGSAELGMYGAICHREDFSPFNCRTFPGHTDKGLGLGATRAEIEAAHGPPAHVEIDRPFERTVNLVYVAERMELTLFENKLAYITLSAPRAAK